MRIEARTFLGVFSEGRSQQVSQQSCTVGSTMRAQSHCIWDLRTVRETATVHWSCLLRTKSTVCWAPAVYHTLAASLLSRELCSVVWSPSWLWEGTSPYSQSCSSGLWCLSCFSNTHVRRLGSSESHTDLGGCKQGLSLANHGPCDS